jgi:hypothetical protein
LNSKVVRRHPVNLVVISLYFEKPMPGNRRKARFSLWTMLVVMSVLICSSYYAYRSWQAAPLRNAVADFNAAASKNIVGAAEPPLTVEEIREAIRTQLSSYPYDDWIKDKFRRIAATGQLPPDATISSIYFYEQSPSDIKTVWWVDLDIGPREPESDPRPFYRLRVRKTDQPRVTYEMLKKHKNAPLMPDHTQRTAQDRAI